MHQSPVTATLLHSRELLIVSCTLCLSRTRPRAFILHFPPIIFHCHHNLLFCNAVCLRPTGWNLYGICIVVLHNRCIQWNLSFWLRWSHERHTTTAVDNGAVGEKAPGTGGQAWNPPRECKVSREKGISTEEMEEEFAKECSKWLLRVHVPEPPFQGARLGVCPSQQQREYYTSASACHVCSRVEVSGD